MNMKYALPVSHQCNNVIVLYEFTELSNDLSVTCCVLVCHFHKDDMIFSLSMSDNYFKYTVFQMCIAWFVSHLTLDNAHLRLYNM